jgi:DNA helicase-2/ATP-dependent DNA helicase PcrA
MSRDYVLQPFRPPVQPQIDYAAELNEQQCAAVTAAPGPALVIAGAGSGKTRTLTYRVAFLLEQGIAPERILLLTFTNKAAKEMMRRVADLLGGELSGLWGGTFHSIGNRVLRRHAKELGYQPDFSILDRDDSKELIQACVGAMPDGDKRLPKADVLADIFSLAVNKDEEVAATIAEQFDYFSEVAEQIAMLRRQYRERKKAANAMDFDDLLALWLKAMKDHAEIREDYQRRFQFIMVDEYQDTNKIQGDLIDLLAARHRNVMVVGDDSQSIYSWRGAHFQNILKFPERYPEAKIYRIETNYRSSPEILAVANAAIAANTQQFPKHLEAARQSKNKPVKVTCMDGREQAAFVAQRALELRDEGMALKNMAVLYRSHFHALELQFELTRRNIPFVITSGMRFFEQAHVKDVAAYLKFVNNPQDELAFKRIVRLLNGVGNKSADKVWSAFAGQPLAGPEAPARLATALQRIKHAVPRKAEVDWAQLAATIAQLEAADTRGKASKMIQIVLEAGYEEYLQEKYTNYQSRREDLVQLAAFAAPFASVEEFLTQLALQSGVESEEDEAKQRDDEQIRLSTIHQAKGLEFEAVFIIMLCDGMFPSSRSIDHPDALEEERRLFYVAITRAKDELYLCHPLIRTSAGIVEKAQQPSRFLFEIPAELLDEWNLRQW